MALIAVKYIEGEDSFYSLDDPLVRISLKFMDVGQYENALNIAKTIEEASYQAEALTNIAIKFSEAGHGIKASEIMSQAEQAVSSIERADIKSRTFTDMARKYIKAGLTEGASQVLSQALGFVPAIEGRSFSRDLDLVSIAKLYVELGEYEVALLAAKDIEDSEYITGVLVTIAEKIGSEEKKISINGIKILHQIIKNLD